MRQERTYSAYEAAAFIQASDSESNGVFGNESTLESSDSYDSAKEPCFPDMELIKHKKMTNRYVSKITFLGTSKSFDFSSLFRVDKVVAIIVQF